MYRITEVLHHGSTMSTVQSAPKAAGREPDHGDGVTIYRHTLAGFTIRTHRTVRSTPAGWVYGIHDDDGQHTYGYADTQSGALNAAAIDILGPNRTENTK